MVFTRCVPCYWIFCLIYLSESKTPVVIVPGDGGSRLEAQINKPSVPHYWCEKTSSWFDLWLSVEQLLPLAMDCWSDNIKLAYNSTLNKVTNSPGVEVRVPDFGGTSAISYLDPSLSHPGEYFAEMIQAFEKQGYEVGVSLRAAPYDFRYAPNSAKLFFANLKALIEETYQNNSKTPVLLMSHSLGCPYTRFFLNQQTQDWRDTHIRAWVSISGAWAGSAKLFRIFASGDDLGYPNFIVNPLTLRHLLRTYESSAFLLPSGAFWSKDEVIVETPKRNYSLGNLDQFFEDIGYPEAMKIRELVPPIWPDEQPPNVTLFCLYGTDVPTPAHFVYKEGQFPDTLPQTLTSDGDGTVNIRSLQACEKFVDKQPYKVVMQNFTKGEHQGIISDPRLIKFVENLLEGFNEDL